MQMFLWQPIVGKLCSVHTLGTDLLMALTTSRSVKDSIPAFLISDWLCSSLISWPYLQFLLTQKPPMNSQQRCRKMHVTSLSLAVLEAKLKILESHADQGCTSLSSSINICTHLFLQALSANTGSHWRTFLLAWIWPAESESGCWVLTVVHQTLHNFHFVNFSSAARYSSFVELFLHWGIFCWKCNKFHVKCNSLLKS